MKAVLEFELPEEEAAFREAANGSKAHDALRALFEWLRSQEKYRGRTSVDVEEVRDVVRPFFGSGGLTIDDYEA